MHPSISKLPSDLFYESKIQDGPDMAAKTAQPWHQSPFFGVYKFFDVRGEEEQAERGHSQLNVSEAKLALALYTKLRHDFAEPSLDYRIGIVSMYRAQLTKMKALFVNMYGREILSKIDFNTVDGFQGQEKDIIILSCVRAGPSVTSIGFLSDRRRMNVAITRSRSSLFILGHASTLKRSDEVWRKIVEDASDRKLLVNKV
jgi:senataxin